MAVMKDVVVAWFRNDRGRRRVTVGRSFALSWGLHVSGRDDLNLRWDVEKSGPEPEPEPARDVIAGRISPYASWFCWPPDAGAPALPPENETSTTTRG